MKADQDYLARAQEAEKYAARCVEGSQQQRAFLEIAAQWRALAERSRRPG